eukprot:4063962-Amphidinium_carterae.1
MHLIPSMRCRGCLLHSLELDLCPLWQAPLLLLTEYLHLHYVVCGQVARALLLSSILGEDNPQQHWTFMTTSCDARSDSNAFMDSAVHFTCHEQNNYTWAQTLQRQGKSQSR